MNPEEKKYKIQDSIKGFLQDGLAENAINLLSNLGYQSERRFADLELTPKNIADLFPSEQTFRDDKAIIDQWKSVHFLFQLTGDEITDISQGRLAFTEKTNFDPAIYQSYLFFTIELIEERYSRTKLSQITREINKLFLIPVMVLFKHGNTLTKAIINRRPHKREEHKDVLEKVTLIKDISIDAPHRAHIEILFDLSLEELESKYPIKNFLDLHNAWQITLDASELNKRFFRELANWYFWTTQNVTFPEGAGEDEETRNATSVIRLITRMIFIWFIKEKGLVPEILFDPRRLKEILIFMDYNDSTYYKAILQNLFFATLNQEMNTLENPDKRKFRGKKSKLGGRDQHYLIHNVYRYEGYFNDSEQALKIFDSIPFLNGGLFECLDHIDKDDPSKIIRIDGFSDREDNPIRVPDYLFFGDEQDVDLNNVYGTKNKRYKVCGLIHTLNRYKFTIEENTPIEEEVALDPELLGRVFENLLAAYNPETGTTARKQTGSFYTPREIVNYMVDESLIGYLNTKLFVNKDQTGIDKNKVDNRLRELFEYSDNPHQFNSNELNVLITAIDSVNVLDPAVGSGAYSMGILQKLVYVLSKLDPGNEKWKEKQIEKVMEIPDSTIREPILIDIEDAFSENDLDYGRKLYLIENCIFGVDIQPIAVQIVKLRFFITLVVDQITDLSKLNLGIRPLPNLETKFVAANTLIGIEKPNQLGLRNPEINIVEEELINVRSSLFNAKTPATKHKYRLLDAQLRARLVKLLKLDGWGDAAASQLAIWDPYEQNTNAEFFDPEWMFGVNDGFDIVIGNPPYIDSEGMVNSGQKELRNYIAKNYQFAKGNWDIYIAFFEIGLEFLNKFGYLTYITPDKWISKPFGKELLKNTLSNIHSILNTGRDIFTSANVDSIVSLFSKKKTKRLKVLSYQNGEPVLINEVDKNIIKYPYALDFLFSEFLSFLIKLDMNHHELSDIAICESACATSDAYKLKPLIQNLDSSSDFNTNLFKVINTGTIDKYVTKWGRREMTYLRDKYLLPVVKREVFTQHFTQSYRGKAIQPKIIIKGLTLLHGCLDEFGDIIPGKSTLVICSEDIYTLKFLMGFLNSKLPIFYIREKYSASSYNTGINFTKHMINNFPIPKVSTSTKESIVNIVNQILSLKEVDPVTDTSMLEEDIDRLVYNLYGLSEEEIFVVENYGI